MIAKCPAMSWHSRVIRQSAAPTVSENDSVYTVLAKADTTLCFAYNLIEGKCYVDGDTTPPAFTIKFLR